MLDAAEAAGLKVAVIVMDLDRFKDINDVHGHRAGDALLRSLTARLKEVTTAASSWPVLAAMSSSL